MEKDNENNEYYCYLHDKCKYEYYCCDDKKFLCSKCFKGHYSHNFELREDLRKKEKLYKELKNIKITYDDYLIKIQKGFEEIMNELTKELNEIKNFNISENKNNKSTPIENKNIFELDFTEYKKFSLIMNLYNKMTSISNKLINLKKWNKNI